MGEGEGELAALVPGLIISFALFRINKSTIISSKFSPIKIIQKPIKKS